MVIDLDFVYVDSPFELPPKFLIFCFDFNFGSTLPNSFYYAESFQAKTAFIVINLQKTVDFFDANFRHFQ